MKALVLESIKKLSLRDMDLYRHLGDNDVRIAVNRVGICGSDLHYYLHGSIGPFVVRDPMVLGHEASGTVVEAGKNVRNLKPGDKVCMEPGVPTEGSRASLMGMYNLDPEVTFWATPPIHGCLCETVVHPAKFTYKLPDSVSLAEGALVEPFAVGMHAATKAEVRPGDTAVVTGAGTIGMMTAVAALAAGCSRIFVTDVLQPKLDVAEKLGPVTGINIKSEDAVEVVKRETDGWGADIVFEASGNAAAFRSTIDFAAPGGKIVLIGMPPEPVAFDISTAQSKELTFKTIFRYAHVYPRAIALIASGKANLKPLITDVYPFAKSVEAFEYAASPRPQSVKVQIEL